METKKYQVSSPEDLVKEAKDNQPRITLPLKRPEPPVLTVNHTKATTKEKS